MTFQVWNIKNNKMFINRKPDSKSFDSQLIFKNNRIYINPWVDSECDYNYTIDKNGTLTLSNEYIKMKLVPHFNCTSNQGYFDKKTNGYIPLKLTQETITGISVYPKDYENELIVLKDYTLLFNNKVINNIKELPIVENKSIWLHIDKNTILKKILPLLKSVNDKGYVFSFSAISKVENNEQVFLLKRNIENIKKIANKYEINICDYCEKHNVDKVENLLEIEMLNAKEYIFQKDTTDLFHIRNSIVRFIKKNRNTRLNTKIKFKIPTGINFEDYLRMIDELKFVHIELNDIIIYNGIDDKDTEDIKNNILDRTKEFPLRIVEIIE